MIKIAAENEFAIEQVLKLVNGKAKEHTFSRSIEIQRIADEADRRLDTLGVPKSMRKGALYIADSGEQLPRAYKYAATITSVTIERRSSGWYLRDAERSHRYGNERPYRQLVLTREQDERVIENIRKLYHIKDA